MKLLLLNGPNLNMLGIREVDLYGSTTYEELVQQLEEYAYLHRIDLEIRQSNHEGDLIDWIQEAYFKHYDGLIINPGGYTHTSVALRDALIAIQPFPTIEVHITDIDQREDFRRVNYVSDVVSKSIVGHGVQGYFEAIHDFLKTDC